MELSLNSLVGLISRAPFWFEVLVFGRSEAAREVGKDAFLGVVAGLLLGFGASDLCLECALTGGFFAAGDGRTVL